MVNENERQEMMSIIIPCYNEEVVLPYFSSEIRKEADRMSASYNICLELIFIDDGSKDRTLELLRNLAKEDTRVYYISFSRNFGKEAALFAGLKYARGDYIAVMDADMQDPPVLLSKMFEIIKNEGFDSVASRRVNRKGEPLLRSFFARSFYKIINLISDADIVDGARDFRLMNRKMVNAILLMNEHVRFSKGIFGWVGFKTKWLPYENVERIAGKTKWSFWNLFQYSLQGIISFSTVPLTFVSVFGLLVCIAAIVLIICASVNTLIVGNTADGWTFLICIILMMSGIQISCIGILGQYLEKTYQETKGRPIYIVAETNEERNNHEPQIF